MYIYIISTYLYTNDKTIKIGSTENPYSRIGGYLTSYPPNFKELNPTYYRIYETTTKSRDELYEYEEFIHVHFKKYRQRRNGHEKHDSSEWFYFSDVEDPIKIVDEFIEKQPWFSRVVQLGNIPHPKTIHSNYEKNTMFIKNDIKRLELLEDTQRPVIAKMCDFVKDSKILAGYVIAPCGSGKTVMTCKSMKITNLSRVIICCPFNQIQNQWRNTLISLDVFSESDILLVGVGGTTNSELISLYMKKQKYCIITTYMSSNIICPLLSSSVQLVCLDEAHHLTGRVAKDDCGEGVTRKIMEDCYKLKVKRLSLTFTPRFLTKITSDTSSISMDDEHIFGQELARLNLRKLINLGILPDYRVWSLSDSSNKASGTLAKATYLLDAWNKTEWYRGSQRHIINHLIIYTATLEDGKILEEFLSCKTIDTAVINVKGGDNTQVAINKFTEASRGIIINCKVFNEGVDIPIADSVAIIYPKQSTVEITQMLLRAGRWYTDKPLFHMLIPIIDSDDLTGFQDVLMTLASSDEALQHELLVQFIKGGSISEESNRTVVEPSNCLPESIIIELYEGSKLDDLNRMFKRKFLGSLEHKQIQKVCIEHNVKTSVEYSQLREQLVDLVEDPRNRGESWFTFLNPTTIERITPKEFVEVLDKEGIKSPIVYDNWLLTNKIIFPSVQNILDGYFGDETNFSIILSKYTTVKKFNGRR
jgi:superfamily II DNA or RNA helicase